MYPQNQNSFPEIKIHTLQKYVKSLETNIPVQQKKG